MPVRKNTYIDPIFWTPEDVVDLVPSVEETDFNIGDDSYVTETEYFNEEEGQEESWSDSIIEDNESEEPSVALPTVDNFTVVSQTVRVAPDGSHVVDVIIEVDDLDGVIGYDVRLTRA